MHKIKINILAIIGMMVAIGTVAFTAPTKAMNEMFWFSISEDGTVLETYIGKLPEDQNPAGCQELENDHCAVAYTASELINPNSEPQSINDLKPEVLADPLSPTNIVIRYKE